MLTKTLPNWNRPLSTTLGPGVNHRSLQLSIKFAVDVFAVHLSIRFGTAPCLNNFWTRCKTPVSAALNKVAVDVLAVHMSIPYMLARSW